MKLWITCPCGRNLATVTKPPAFWSNTVDGLAVYPRPNVRQDEYEHPGGSLTKHAYTYTWHCHCGKVWERRHEWISAKWQEAHDEKHGQQKSGVRISLDS